MNMLVDGLGAASFVNGVLRVETLERNARGEDIATGELHIPAVRIGVVAAGFQRLLDELREKTAEARAQQDKTAEG